MSLAATTSIKIRIIERVKSILGEGKYLDSPPLLEAKDCVPFCCVVGSNSPSLYTQKTHGVFEIKVPIVLDLFVQGKKQPEIDKLLEDVLSAVLVDRSLDGLLHNLEIQRTEVRSFDNAKKIAVLMFDLEASYYKEIPSV
jgi:hypothetical protein